MESFSQREHSLESWVHTDKMESFSQREHSLESWVHTD